MKDFECHERKGQWNDISKDSKKWRSVPSVSFPHKDLKSLNINKAMSYFSKRFMCFLDWRPRWGVPSGRSPSQEAWYTRALCEKKCKAVPIACSTSTYCQKGWKGTLWAMQNNSKVPPSGDTKVLKDTLQATQIVSQRCHLGCPKCTQRHSKVALGSPKGTL